MLIWKYCILDHFLCLWTLTLLPLYIFFSHILIYQTPISIKSIEFEDQQNNLFSFFNPCQFGKYQVISKCLYADCTYVYILRSIQPEDGLCLYGYFTHLNTQSSGQNVFVVMCVPDNEHLVTNFLYFWLRYLIRIVVCLIYYQNDTF